MSDGELSTDDEENESRTLITRRRAVRGVSFAAGAGLVGGAGLWYSSQPVVADSGVEDGAENVEFGTDEDVISVTNVTIAPEIDVAFDNFSSGVDSAEIGITLQVEAEQEDDETYEGTSDTWDAPSAGSSESVTFAATIPTDGETNTWDPEIGIGTFEIATPDFTETIRSSLEEDGHFEFNDPIPLQDVLEEDADIGAGEGIEMFPQDIDPDHYGLSVVDVDYSITLQSDVGEEDTDDSPDHAFDVAVENEAGTMEDSEVDSHTAGDGEDGT